MYYSNRLIINAMPTLCLPTLIHKLVKPSAASCLLTINLQRGFVTRHFMLLWPPKRGAGVPGRDSESIDSISSIILRTGLMQSEVFLSTGVPVFQCETDR